MTLKDHSLASNASPVITTDPADLMLRLDEGAKQRMYTLLQAELELDITKINLTEALMIQYQQAARFVDEILHDKDVPANQRAQAMNSANSALKEIIKLRNAVMSQERLRRYEKAFISVLDKCGTPEQKDTWMDLYGEFLEDKGE